VYYTVSSPIYTEAPLYDDITENQHNNFKPAGQDNDGAVYLHPNFVPPPRHDTNYEQLDNLANKKLYMSLHDKP